MSGGVESSCYFCGAPGWAGTTCVTCGLGLPDPRLPDASASATGCPRCVGSALAPIALAEAGPDVACGVCGTCHGIFVGARSWDALVRQPELAKKLEAGLPVRAKPASELVGLLRCPVCRREMDRGTFAASSGVVVDVCATHGMWLDAGELGDVVTHAASRRQRAPSPSLQRAIAEGEVMRRQLMPSSPSHPSLPQIVVVQEKRRGGLLIGLLITAAVMSLVGGVVAYKAYTAVKDQVPDMPGVAASASGELQQP